MERAPTAPRRTQAERSEATTARLIGTARALFAREGYARTSLEAVCAEAGVTKGALYHHFAGKAELFEAVFEAEERELCASLVRGAGSGSGRRRDPWQTFQAGCRAFLQATLDPGVQRITLLDAPGVLGWKRMREIEADYGLRLLKEGLRHAADAGRLRTHDVDGLAHLLFGALCEGAMYIARAPDQDAALKRTTRELNALLDGLAA